MAFFVTRFALSKAEYLALTLLEREALIKAANEANRH